MINTSMLAAVFEGPNQLALKQQPVRLPEADEILVQVAACGLCGTDTHIYQGDKGSAESPAGTVLGHEFSGTVAATGADVIHLSVGDRVAIDPNDNCGACGPCRSGKAHFCENMTGIGTTVHGGFAQYCTCKAKQAYLLPEQMNFTAAAFAEPVACCLHGLDLTDFQSGQRVLIIGGGTIGLIMLQLVRLHGASSAALIEPHPGKRKLARQLGADLCIDPDEPNISKVLTENGFSHIDLSIECAGLGTTARQAIDLTSRGGTVLLFGLTSPDCEISLRPFELFERELKLLGSFINPYTMGRAISLLSQNCLEVESLISQQIDLSDIERVFKDDSLRKQGKVMIKP